MRRGNGWSKSMILYNHDMPSGNFQKFMYSYSVSKYEVIVYKLVFTHLQFALVKILTNQTTVRML